MSTVREQVERLAAIKERMRTNLVAQGVTVPDDTMLDAMAEQVLSVAGEDGVSCTHAWNGTTLTVTSASGTTSANLRGPQGIQGEVGPTGPAGSAGSDANVTSANIAAALGYTPANGASYLPLSGGTMTGELRVNGGDAANGSKIVLETNKGQITNSGTQTLFGFVSAGNLAIGHSSYNTQMRGKASRPTYNGASMALQSDVPTDYATKAEVEAKAPAYTYSTADLTAGSSALETGKLYLVYE